MAKSTHAFYLFFDFLKLDDVEISPWTGDPFHK